MPTSLDELHTTITETFTAAGITFGVKGDRIYIRKGSTAVFMKPVAYREKHTIIEMLVPVLQGVESSLPLLEKLNELNRDLFFGKAYTHECGVWLAHNLLGDTIDPVELLTAAGDLVVTADKLDDELKGTFGGTRWAES